MKQRVTILNYAGCNNYGANLTAYALSANGQVGKQKNRGAFPRACRAGE